jgi:F-box/leucine-rich repeat protein 7
VAVPDPFAMVRAYDSDTNPARPIRPSPLAASTIQGLPLDLLDRLRSFPLFQAAPDSFLAAVGLHLKPQLYQPHDTILTEGETGKAMYWLVRGAVRVTSRDQESTYAELKPGAFFGEIGILMDIPRTATIIANMRSLVVRLNKEDLKKELLKFPEVEMAIMHEAQERLAILERKKKELGGKRPALPLRQITGKRDREDGDVVMAETGVLRDGEVINAYKKRKSPSPGLSEAIAHSAFGSGGIHVRPLLKELPLFSSLPDDILHFIGMRAQPLTFPPFYDIIKQGTQGRDVFFIVKGEVEVVNVNAPDMNGHTSPTQGRRKSIAAGEHHFQEVRARLKPGQYFGEVVSLSLAPRRTATVRSISSVEVLMISGDTLNQLWEKCTPDVRRQVESVAKERLQTAQDNDIHMADINGTPNIDDLAIADIIGPRTPRRKKSVPTVTFSDLPMHIDSPVTPSRREEKVMEPFDPDPFLNVDLDNVRSRSRRGSLAPPTPDSPSSPTKSEFPKSPSPNLSPLSPSPHPISKHTSTPPEAPLDFKRPRMIRRPSKYSRGRLPDPILTNVFGYLDIHELMKLRAVSWHWHKTISSSPDILHDLDLTKFNRKVTDRTLVDIICPFAGTRPRYINISNCFHVTDEGFAELAKTCGPSAKVWRMKSVWDITGPAVLEMVQKAKGLEEVDLSNCRKVGDNLLARVIGWVVPELPPQMAMAHAQHQAQMNGRRAAAQGKGANNQQPPQPLPPGTVVGCPKLRRLTLSYCKHITDRSMAHIAVHAANRIESIDLTRCTTITDVGFQHWSVYPFPRLTKLCLADCTYLTDNAIVYLTNAAKGLKELDLVSHLIHIPNCALANYFYSPSAAPSRTQQQKSSHSASLL